MKNRRYVSTPYSGIFKVQAKDEKTGKWVEPLRGAKFLTRRYVNSVDGKQVQIKKHFETIAEAKAFRNGTPVEKEQEQMKKPSDRMTFRELVEDWKEHWLPNKDLSTQIRYKSYLKHFDFFMNLAVDEIAPIQIDKWITRLKHPEYLKTQHSTRCSYDHEFTVLRGILNYYSSRFNRNYRLPFIKDHNEMLRVRTKPKIKKDLTVDQFKAFVQALRGICLNTKWEAIYYLALMQYGIYGRIQDAAALSYEDFDFVNNKVSVNKKVQWLRAKGFKDRIVDGSKTNDGKILSPIPELAIQVFREWLIRSGVRSGGLFHIDGEIMTYRQIENRYTQALRMAGLPFSATHILRHASLTEAYASCKDLLQVQQLAGQTDYKSTTRYAKVRDEQIAETQKKMDQKMTSIFG